MSPIIIMGLDDPEANEIEQITRALDLNGFFAAHNGKRVNRSNAYHANDSIHFSGIRANPENFTSSKNTIIQIECYHQGLIQKINKRKNVSKSVPSVITIDHHHEGDSGYDCEPEQFMFGSSLGQFINYLVKENYDIPGYTWVKCEQERTPGIALDDDLGWIAVRESEHNKVYAQIPKRHLFLAAADHCLPQAYRGRCSGVDPEEIIKFRVWIRAERQNVDIESIEKRINNTRSILRRMNENGQVDLTKLPSGSLPEVVEASVRESLSVLSMVKDKQTKRNKMLLLGYNQPEDVKEWMNYWKGKGYEVYGSPVRGYAGAIEPRNSKSDIQAHSCH